VKSQSLIIFILILIIQDIQSQSTIIGNVFYQSSGKKPAVGVKVNAEGSNGDYSKAKGEYTLTFPHLTKGKTVKPFIGDNNNTIRDGSGNMIELVNEKSLEYFTIPENPNDAPLKIIVCPKGFRDIAAQKYYMILKVSSDNALRKIKNELISLLAQKDQDNAKMAELSAQLASLGGQIDSISLIKEAFTIASINKDDASERILRYIKLLDEGKSVQEAREVLSIKSAAKDLEESARRFNSAIEELKTRASASITMYDYKDALSCFDTILHYSELVGIDPIKTAGFYDNAANASWSDGQYEKALSYEQNAVKIKEKMLDSLDLNLASSYNYLAAIFRDLGQFNEALVYNQKELGIKEKKLDAKDLELSFAYNNIGSTYQVMGQYEKALDYYEKSLVIQEEILLPDDPDLADGFASIAVTYQNIGQFDKALEFELRSLAIKEKVLDKMDPSLALCYNNISVVFQSLGQYEKALENIQKAITIKEKNLDPKHPDLAISYDNIAVCYRLTKEFEKSLEYHQKSIKIKEEVLDSLHPSLATSYEITGKTYWTMGKYNEALKYFQNTLKIRETIFEPNHTDLALLNFSIAQTYKEVKLFSDAIIYIEKALPVFTLAFPENHPYFIQVQKVNNLRLDFYYAKGIQEFERKEYRTALSDFNTVVAARDSSFVWNNIGQCYYQLKDYPKAVAAYKKAAMVNSETNNQLFYSNLGMAYAKNNQLADAQDAFRQYEKINPNFAMTHRNWGMYYSLKNDKVNALLNLQKAIKLGYVDLTFLVEDDGFDNIRNEKEFIILLVQLEKEILLKSNN